MTVDLDMKCQNNFATDLPWKNNVVIRVKNEFWLYCSAKDIDVAEQEQETTILDVASSSSPGGSFTSKVNRTVNEMDVDLKDFSKEATMMRSAFGFNNTAGLMGSPQGFVNSAGLIGSPHGFANTAGLMGSPPDFANAAGLMGGSQQDFANAARFMRSSQGFNNEARFMGSPQDFSNTAAMMGAYMNAVPSMRSPQGLADAMRGSSLEGSSNLVENAAMGHVFANSMFGSPLPHGAISNPLAFAAMAALRDRNGYPQHFDRQNQAPQAQALTQNHPLQGTLNLEAQAHNAFPGQARNDMLALPAPDANAMTQQGLQQQAPAPPRNDMLARPGSDSNAMTQQGLQQQPPRISEQLHERGLRQQAHNTNALRQGSQGSAANDNGTQGEQGQVNDRAAVDRRVRQRPNRPSNITTSGLTSGLASDRNAVVTTPGTPGSAVEVYNDFFTPTHQLTPSKRPRCDQDE